jgi:hypothetical protein
MVETAKYKVARKIGDIEIREYPEMLLATVSGMEDDSSFGLLFNYISGANRGRKKLAMTAPVVSSERIAMTAPVVSGESFVTFVLPSHFTLENAPQPTDSRIRIHMQPVRIFAVLRFGGRSTEDKFKDQGKILLDVLSKNNIETRGGLFLMRYNSPFAPGFMRRNEVGIEIRRQ